jgi:site-specific DNA recombinase
MRPPSGWSALPAISRPAAVCGRISSDQEGTGLSVQRQLENCGKLAASEGWKISDEYADNDVSAFKGKRQPRNDDVLADLRDGACNGVLLYHQAQLTRRPIELEQFVEVIEAAATANLRTPSNIRQHQATPRTSTRLHAPPRTANKQRTNGV